MNFAGAGNKLAVLLALALLVWATSVVRAADAADPAAEPAALGSDAPQPPAEAISTRNLVKVLIDGGPLMIALAGCSLLLITFVFERAISLRRSRVIPKPFLTRMLEQVGDGEIDRAQAMELCEQNGSPIAQVFAGAIRKWGRPSVEVEQAAIDSGERVANHLRRYLRVFYGVANVGPLLGLMGTVLGMIQTFNAIASHDALGRAELLAGGIAKALLNTAGGLAVAIPASIFYVVFLSRVDRLIMDIDAASQEMVNLISAEELRSNGRREAKQSGRRGEKQPKEKAMPLKTHPDEQPVLNLTAMLDVMFLLIIFFVLNTKFLDDERQISLQVPQVTAAAKLTAAAPQKTINVYRDGTITLDQVAVTLPELPARLAAARGRAKTLTVLVRGDGHGEFQQMADVLTACKQAGISDLAISVRSAPIRK